MDRTFLMECEHFWFHVSVDESPDPAKFERHCHDCYELIYVVRGAGHYVVEGERYALRPGSLFLFRPREYHYVDVLRRAPYERYVIHFAPEGLPDEVRPFLAKLDARRDGANYYDPAEVPLALSAIFDQLNTVSGMPKREGEILSRLILSELLVTLSVALPAKPEESEPLGLRVVKYLNDHITEKIVLEDLSRHFFVSKYYVCRAFRAHNGVSILQYVTEKRVHLARRRMEQGETAVTAAMEAGFGDYSSFYRAHLRVTGEAPSGRETAAKRRQTV